MSAEARESAAPTPDASSTPRVFFSMKRLINQLVQLQELLETRAQQLTIGAHDRLAELDTAIGALTRDLDPALASTFVKMHQRLHTAIVPVIHSACAGCGMALPISQAHAVRAATEVHRCSNCGRFIYVAETVAGKRPAAAGRVPKAGVARFSSPQLMLPNLKSEDREGALAEICGRMESAGFAESAAALVERALQRESIMPTALENGIAFPHVRGVEGGGLTLALAVRRKGIRFSSATRGLTRILFFVVIPSAASAFYLKLLAGLAQTFEKAEAREKLMAAETPEELWKALCQTTRRAIP